MGIELVLLCHHRYQLLESRHEDNIGIEKKLDASKSFEWYHTL